MEVPDTSRRKGPGVAASVAVASVVALLLLSVSGSSAWLERDHSGESEPDNTVASSSPTAAGAAINASSSPSTSSQPTSQPTNRPLTTSHPHSPPPRTGLEVPLVDESANSMVYASAMRWDPNLAKAIPPEKSANSVHAWRTRQNAERAKYRAQKHELCPKTKDDYVTISQLVGWTELGNSLSQCPVKCRQVDRLVPETTIYIEGSVVTPRRAPPPVLAGVFCLEPECNFPHPYVRDNTFGGIENAELVVNFDRASDVTITYADGYSSYGKCASYHLSEIDPAKCLPPVPTREELGRKKLGTAFIGNCGRPRRRLDWPETFHRSGWSSGHGRRRFFERLQQHLKNKGRQIDSYAGCLHTAGLEPIPDVHGIQRYLVQIEKIRGYKFHMAFENMIIPDYSTEKQWVGVFGGAVPVVLGDDVDFVPGGRQSYISALDFSGPEALGDYLLELDADPDKYLEFFEWRKKPVSELFKANLIYGFNYQGNISWPCRLCQRYLREFCQEEGLGA